MCRAVIYSISVLAFLAFKLGGFDFLRPVLSVLSVIAIVISIPQAGWPAKIFSFFFLATGTWLVLKKGIGIYQYLLTYGEMLYLLSLFAMLPLLAIPIRIGRYDLAIEQLLGRKVKTPAQLYRIISSISFLLSSFVNLATLPIMYHCVRNAAAKIVKSNTDKFIATAIIQGFTVSVTWTPLSGVVGVALEVSQVTWQKIFPVLFFISFAALLLNWFIFSTSDYLAKKKSETQSEDNHMLRLTSAGEEMAVTQSDADPVIHPLRKLLEIIGAIILLIMLVVIFNHILAVGIVVTGAVIAAPAALLWAISLKKMGAFLKAARSYVFDSMPGMAEQFAIFLSAGFFVTALHFSGYNHVVNDYFVDFNHLVGGRVFLIILPLITMSFCFIGMHPIAAMTLLAESLNPFILGITPEQLAIALIGGAVMTFMVGPFSGTMNVMSSIIKVNQFRIATWSPIPAAVYYLMIVLILLLY
jgi:hypothetical protein